MDDRVELRAVAGLERLLASDAEEEREPPLASARKAVPLLWLALFDYDDVEVRRDGALDVFLASTGAAAAAERARVLARALASSPPPLVEAATALQGEVARVPAGKLVALYPLSAFAGLRQEEARAYLEQLVRLCDLWEQLRRGRPFDEVWLDLGRVFPGLDEELGLSAAPSSARGPELAPEDPRVGGYYLVGSLIDRARSFDPHLIREGQGEKDLQPQALAVGEHGLLLGRFAGRWKLMSSGAREDLHGVWAEGPLAYIVGRRGTVLRLRKGRCAAMEAPTDVHLRAVWGLHPKFVCAVGDAGTLIAYDGRAWQPWPVPSQATLHCLAGSGPDRIFVGGQEAAVLEFDGRSWRRAALPEDTMLSQICADDGEIYAAGGSARGGELLRLARDGWTPEAVSPRPDWIEGMWKGWGAELGLAPGGGPLLVKEVAGWRQERIPVERVVAVASGSSAMAVGEVQKHSVILARGERGWCVECAVPELRLLGLWVGGRPKPPRADAGPAKDDRKAARDA